MAPAASDKLGEMSSKSHLKTEVVYIDIALPRDFGKPEEKKLKMTTSNQENLISIPQLDHANGRLLHFQCPHH